MHECDKARESVNALTKDMIPTIKVKLTFKGMAEDVKHASSNI